MDYLQEKDENMAGGILLAFVCMLAAVAVTALAGWFIGWQGVYWIGGAVIGTSITFGYQKGKGAAGVARYIILILFSFKGAFIAVVAGYTLFLY